MIKVRRWLLSRRIARDYRAARRDRLKRVVEIATELRVENPDLTNTMAILVALDRVDNIFTAWRGEGPVDEGVE